MPEFTEQSVAAAALVMLMTEKLPQCSWIVLPETGLEGWIVEKDDRDFDRFEAIHIWAKKLGTGVSRVGKMLITYGTYSHVPVRILVKDGYRWPDNSPSLTAEELEIIDRQSPDAND